ncbi:hypothetical protein Atep_07060 [Allochromatium tepidum]|uniref:Uncharacterized protein n=1 Tax=Allochromatium tepidum TaxID=553982 RepID=A0ABM7QJW5_9GAMM|nr:hypothetical protein Atep_07060 [Allochromatium tepidum]
MLIDTDVLIWYMRGHAGAYDKIENLPDITLFDCSNGFGIKWAAFDG